MKSNTSKIVKLIFLSPIILILLAVAFCEVNKAYWDHQVKLMCEKDGGVIVYEKVEISKNDYPNMKFISSGLPIIPFEDRSKHDDPFVISFNSLVINKIFPSVGRSETKIIRRHDSKVLSIKIGYTRSGGDFPTGFEPSHFSCRSIRGINTDLDTSTFIVKGE